MFANRFGLYPPEKIIVLTNTAEHSKRFDDTAAYRIIRTPLLANGPKGFEYLGIVWRLITIGISVIRTYRVEVIQCSRPLPEGLAGYVIAKLFSKKLVINFHGEEISVLRHYKVERVLLKRVIRAADLNLANSTFTETLIKQVAGKHVNTAVIVPGCHPACFPPSTPEKVAALRQYFGGAPVLMTIGRLQRRKGQDQVIRALPQIIRHFPNVRYVIIGPEHGGTSGWQQHLSGLAAQLGVENHVLLIGEVEFEELSNYYTACDLFIMANRCEPGGDVEGFGIVFLEAGFFGKPVIGGNSGGVPDAIQHGKTGLLVDGTSVDDIAQGIITLLADPQRAQQMGEQGREFALSLTHTRVFEQYAALMTSSGL